MTTSTPALSATESNVHDRVLGALWALAAGDALGATVEFMTPAAIAERHGTHTEIIGGGPFGWRPGQGTDDTDLTYATLRAYLDEPFPTLNNFGARYLEWFNTNPPDIGGTTRTALATLARTGDPTTSGSTEEHSQGNGSLMRCMPTAIMCRNTPGALEHESRAISAITHAHPNCADACVAYNRIAASLINGDSVASAIAAARAHTDNDTVAGALDVDPTTPVGAIPTSGWVIDSLRAAVWAIQQPTSLEETLIALVNRGDDADTTGAIAGGLLGAAHGTAAIPTRWIETLEYRDTLAAAATAAITASPLPETTEGQLSLS